MKIKERRKKTTAASNFFLWKEGFIRPYQKAGSTDFDELQVIDSSNNESTNSRVMGESVGKGCFVGRGRTDGAIKLAIGMVAPTPSILGLLILYSKNVVGL